MTQATIAQIRQALVEKFGTRCYKIKSNGDVFVRCTMPNTRQYGWYLYGDINNIPALELMLDLR